MRKGHRDHYNVWWGEEENEMVQVTEVAQPMTTCFNTLISCADPEIVRRSFQGIGESKSPSQHLPLINPCKNIFKSLCMKPSPHYSQLTPWSNSSSQCILNDSKCWQLCNVSATSALDVMAHCFRGLIGDWIWHLFPTWDFWFN